MAALVTMVSRMLGNILNVVQVMFRQSLTWGVNSNQLRDPNLNRMVRNSVMQSRENLDPNYIEVDNRKYSMSSYEVPNEVRRMDRIGYQGGVGSELKLKPRMVLLEDQNTV